MGYVCISRGGLRAKAGCENAIEAGDCRAWRDNLRLLFVKSGESGCTISIKTRPRGVFLFSCAGEGIVIQWLIIFFYGKVELRC